MTLMHSAVFAALHTDGDGAGGAATLQAGAYTRPLPSST